MYEFEVTLSKGGRHIVVTVFAESTIDIQTEHLYPGCRHECNYVVIIVTHLETFHEYEHTSKIQNFSTLFQLSSLRWTQIGKWWLISHVTNSTNLYGMGWDW